MSSVINKQLYNQLKYPVIILLALLLIGITGYSTIEGYTFLEALYITVITISTVGYGEVRPLSDGGRIFTIVLILLNVIVFSWLIALLTKHFFDGEFIRNYKILKMKNNIQSLKDHVIICGFGRNGHETAQVFVDNKIPFVVIEKSPSNDGNPHVPYYLLGDATEDEVLIEAGLLNAKSIITTLPLDTDNLFVVLTARQLNPDIQVISRATNDSSVNKLKIAGANNVIMPDKIGGAHMATLVLIPDVVEVLSLMSTRNNNDFKVVEMLVRKEIQLEVLDLWKISGCNVLAYKNSFGEYVLNPSPETIINIGESLIIMGSEIQLAEAKKMI